MGSVNPRPVKRPCPGSNCGGSLRVVTWSEVIAQFNRAMKQWASQGFPVVGVAEHSRRVQVCKRCPSGMYRHFQCQKCKCIVLIKAKLKTERCPLSHW